MVLFLIVDVMNNIFQCGFGDTENTIFSLPFEFTGQILFVDMVGTGAFQLSDGGGNGKSRRDRYNNVQVVWHAIDGMRDAFQYSGFSPKVAKQILFPGRIDPWLAVFGRPDRMVEEAPVRHRYCIPLSAHP